MNISYLQNHFINAETMTLREAFETYNFENAGQFSGIAQSLGYETEYRDGHFRFRKGDEDLVMSVSEIRARASMIDDEPGREASKERVAAFFDKDRANDPAYLKELEKEGVSIIRWENLKGEERDGFTIIDHKNKVSYTGQALYEYAQQQGNILDGKGTRLEKGVMSDLMDLNGRPGKLRFNADGISVFYRKESLVIPDKILGKKLSKKDKEQLLAGEVVPIRIRDKDIFLQVDRDLNSVIVRSNQELKIPQVIGKTAEYEGYKLTKSDKYLLANGHSLENKLLHSKDGYFIADIQLTEDRKGVMIQNIQSVSNEKAHEMIQAMRQRLDVQPVGLEQKAGQEPAQGRDRDSEFKEAVGRRDFEKIEMLREEGYKPSEEYVKGVARTLGLDERETEEVRTLFGVKTHELSDNEKQSRRLVEAALEERYYTIQEIQRSGYQITDKDLALMRESGVQPKTLIAVQKIFGLEKQGKTLGDVKLASTPKPSHLKENTRAIGNTVSRAFNDL